MIKKKRNYEQLSLLPWTQTYYGLTFYPPYIELMVKGFKFIETRPRGCNEILPVKICLQTCSLATWKQVPKAERDFYERLATEFLGEWNPQWGSIIAIGDLTQCLKMTESYIRMQSEQERRVGDWQVGRVAWVIKNITTLPTPVPCRGSQSTPYKVPLEVAQKINEVLYA